MKFNDPLNEWNRFIQSGNLDALSGIYFHFYDQLFTYGLKHTTDKQAVEDAIQDVFMNLIKYRKNIGEVKNLPGYLISAFRRQIFLTTNKQKNMIPSGKLQEENFEFFKSEDPDILEKENLEQLHAMIRQCIGKLPSKQREIVFLRFENGISYEEIALMLQISVDSCYKSVYRSIKTIRIEVEKILGKGANIILWFMSKTK
jgi:RNA polymerase sigma factor (sigma-70 family)